MFSPRLCLTKAAALRVARPPFSKHTTTNPLRIPRTMKTRLLPALLLAACLALPAAAKEKPGLSEDMVKAAVQGWCDALLKISKADMEGGDAVAVANEVLSTVYNYDTGEVLFKPTLAHGEQTYRLTKEGALAYFVGGNPKFPDDKGFARKKWVKASFKPAEIIVDDDIGIFMGDVTLTNAEGKETTVNKTFVFKFDDGKPKILAHMSALPYTPADK